MKRILLLVAVLGTSGLVAADAHAGTLSFSGNRKILFVHVEIGETNNVGSLYLTFDSAPHTTQCSLQATENYWWVAGDAAAIEHIRSVALAAKLADRPVNAAWNNAYTANTTVSCSQGGAQGKTGYPVLRGLRIP